MAGMALPLLLHKGGWEAGAMLSRCGWKCEQAGAVEKENGCGCGCVGGDGEDRGFGHAR